MSAPLHIEKFTGTIKYPRKKVQPAYWFRVVAANGEKIAVSEAYTSAQKRNKTAKLLAESKIEIV